MQSMRDSGRSQSDRPERIIEKSSDSKGNWSPEKNAEIREPDTSFRGQILETAKRVTIDDSEVCKSYERYTYSLGLEELESIISSIKENIMGKREDPRNEYNSAIKVFDEKFDEKRYNDIIEKCNRFNDDTELRLQKREDIRSFLWSTNALLVAATREAINKIATWKDNDGDQLSPGDSEQEYHQEETADYGQTRPGQVLVKDMDIDFSLESTERRRATIPEHPGRLVQYNLTDREDAFKIAKYYTQRIVKNGQFDQPEFLDNLGVTTESLKTFRGFFKLNDRKLDQEIVKEAFKNNSGYSPEGLYHDLSNLLYYRANKPEPATTSIMPDYWDTSKARTIICQTMNWRELGKTGFPPEIEEEIKEHPLHYDDLIMFQSEELVKEFKSIYKNNKQIAASRIRSSFLNLLKQRSQEQQNASSSHQQEQ